MAVGKAGASGTASTDASDDVEADGGAASDASPNGLGGVVLSDGAGWQPATKKATTKDDNLDGTPDHTHG